jgi:hypothetical protein
MSVAADDPRPTKRRRLNDITHSQTQALPTPSYRQTYIPLADFSEAISEQERYNHDEPRSANGVCVFGSPASSASPESLSTVELQPSECCYGMVCRNRIPSNRTSTSSLTESLHSCVTFPQTSRTDRAQHRRTSPSAFGAPTIFPPGRTAV